MAENSAFKPWVVSIAVLPAIFLAWGGLLRAQEPFPEGVEGELYYCPLIDRVPAAEGGPLQIKLDGALDEPAWQRAQFQKWSVNAGEMPMRDFNPPELDLDLSWAAVADQDNLYVAWRVVDDMRVTGETTGCNVWMDDSVEVYLDALNDGPDCLSAGNSCYEADDAQITVGADQIGKAGPDDLEFGGVAGLGGRCDFGLPAPEVCRGMVAELVSEDQLPGWQGEIAIALDTLGNGGDGSPEWHITPTHGAIIGWNIHVNDDDGGANGTARDHKLLWSKIEAQETAWRNPGAFGKLQFVVPGKALAAVVRDLPDDLHNGGSGTVTITVTPTLGTGVVTIQEKLPPHLVPSSPSPGGVMAGDTISWNLGRVEAETTVSYTLTVATQAIDTAIPGTATVDGEPTAITGDTVYRGSPISPQGYIKMWNHLGPLASGLADGTTCDPGADLAVDWIINADGTVNESSIYPFPGLVTKPRYGGNGLPGGNGARATGLKLKNGQVAQDQFPVWKGSISPGSTVDHASPQVHGFDANEHVTLSCVYVTNPGPAPIDTQIGLGSDDSIQVWVGETPLQQFNICRDWGKPEEDQDTARVLLPVGESRLLVKVSDGTGLSGFRIRFQNPVDPDPLDEFVPGLLPPAISLSLESVVHPPPGKVARTLSTETFTLNEVVQVSLAATAPAPSGMVVREALPPGTSAVDISDQGVLTNGVLEWNLAGVSARTLTYKLVTSACSADLAYGQSTLQVGQVEALVSGPSTLRRLYQDGPLASWDSRDMGPAGGSAQAVGDHEVAVQGVGAGIRAQSSQKDEFRFVSVQAAGDYEISARIDCLSTTGSRGLAGLMARDTLDSFAANVFFSLSPNPPGSPAVATLKGSSRRQTNQAGITSPITLTSTDVTALPIFLKLKRSGTTLTLERSADGTVYTPVGTRTIGTDVNLGPQSFFGLAVTGGGGSTLAGYSRVSGPPFREELPGPPQGLAAAPFEFGKVRLTWSPPGAGPAPTAYSIHRGAKGGPYTRIDEVQVPALSYTNTGLADDTEYCYVVKSKNQSGESAPSREACARTLPAGGTPFRRGDADGDGAINLTDPIYTLANQFQGGPSPPCMDAADADDQGDYNLTDAIFSLQWQFLAGTEPPKPGPFICGPDDTPTDVFVDCTYTQCGP